jgi:hypothetical protein
MATAFASMIGEEVLSYVRDAILKTVVDKRAFLETSAAVGGAPLSAEELTELRALGAAAEGLQFALSVGQDAKTRGKPVPEWVVRMASQMRSALVEETVGQDET